MTEIIVGDSDGSQEPAIVPIAMADLDPELAAGIRQALASGVLSTSKPVQVWAHQPELAKSWLGLLQSFADDGLLPERTKELVRLKIASVTNCQACRIARKSDTVSEEDIACLSHDDPRFSPAEKVALDYALDFAADHDVIGDAHFEALRWHYSEAEIVELNMYCAIMLAGGRMTYVQRAY
jgi:alkylhydroperoxidase family enzyme